MSGDPLVAELASVQAVAAQALPYSCESGYPLVAVDVGNSRVKCGFFAGAGASALPSPSRTLDLTPGEDDFDALSSWLEPLTPRDVPWWIGSVERQVSSRLVAWLRGAGAGRITLLASSDLPLVVSLPRPDLVGIDRLLAAVAANRLRPPDAPAILVDLGTAITVDLISAAGAFLGGAILPGIGLSARALNEFTDLLPLLDMRNLADPPPALGRNTVEALRSGIYWGAVGGVKQLIELLSAQVAPAPRVYLTGGAAPAVAGLLTCSAEYVGHLTLAGIAIATERLAGPAPAARR
ncbi:MAG TPA: type III pantothenate kinase [Pirellulales bacterium]|nr:type III pantothenate kinase [Pirellulales bacterium]